MEFQERLASYLAESGQQIAFTHARYWVQAVEYQGTRLLAVYDTTAASPFNHTVQRMEEQFYLNAIGKAIRWLRKLATYSDVPEVNTFLNSYGNANFIRDMREHDDEYSLGRGRSKTGEMKELKEPGRTTLNVGQEVTVIQNGKVLLGGRLDVAQVKEAAASLARHLIFEETKQLDKKWHWLGESRHEKLKYLYPPDKLLDK